MTQTPDTHPAIKALEALRKPIRREHSEHEDCDCLHRGEEIGYNAAITASIDTIRSMIVGEDDRLRRTANQILGYDPEYGGRLLLPSEMRPVSSQVDFPPLVALGENLLRHLNRSALATSVEKG